MKYMSPIVTNYFVINLLTDAILNLLYLRVVCYELTELAN
jgi:hypothetical protein